MKTLRVAALAALLVAACSAPPPGPEGRDRASIGTVEEQAKVCAGANTVEGIDVSEFQPNIDWNAVKASGRHFAIIRVSDGNYHDKKFDQHWANAKAAGVIRGAYQFFEPTEDPIAQADYLISKIGGKVLPGDLPPMLDFEKSGVFAEPSASHTQSAMKAWIDHIENVTGRKPIIYTGYYYWNGASVGNPQGYGGYPLAIAAYPSSYTAAQSHSFCPSIPDQWAKWTFWQYSDGSPSVQSGVPPVPGVGQSCDRDFFNGTLAELMAFADSTPPDWAASYVKQSWPLAGAAPIQLKVGETQKGSIDLKNTGGKTWPAGVVKLAPIPRDAASPLAAGTWLSPTRVSTLAADVKPGDTGHFEWDIEGSKEGDEKPFFGLVAEGKAWFADSGGPKDDVIQLNIHVGPAAPGGTGGAGGSAGAPGSAGSGAAGKSGGAGAGAAGKAGGAGATGTAGHSGMTASAGHAGMTTTGSAGAAGMTASAGGASSAAGAGGSDGAPFVVQDEPTSGSSGGCQTGGNPVQGSGSAVGGLLLAAAVLRRRQAKQGLGTMQLG
jgi:lysozyme